MCWGLGPKIEGSGSINETESGHWGPQEIGHKIDVLEGLLGKADITTVERPVLHALLLLVPLPILGRKKKSSDVKPATFTVFFRNKDTHSKEAKGKAGAIHLCCMPKTFDISCCKTW